MKYKDYIEKHKGIIEPLDEVLPKLHFLNTLQLFADEIGGEFSERASEFVEKEKNIILEGEVEK